MLKQRTIIASLMVVLLTVGVSARVFRIRWVLHNRNDAVLMWNSDQAYLLVHSSRLGYERTYWRWLGDVVGAWSRFGMASADEVRRDLTLFRFTAGHVERRLYRDVNTTALRALNGHIYMFMNGSLVRFVGVDLKQTEQDRAALEASGSWTLPGWTTRTNLLSQGVSESEFPFQLGDQRFVVVVVRKDQQQSLEVTVRLPQNTVRQLWSIRSVPRIVSEAEYHTFMSMQH